MCLQASYPLKSLSKVPKVTPPSSGYSSVTPARPPSSEHAPFQAWFFLSSSYLRDATKSLKSMHDGSHLSCHLLSCCSFVEVLIGMRKTFCFYKWKSEGTSMHFSISLKRRWPPGLLCPRVTKVGCFFCWMNGCGSPLTHMDILYIL